MAQVPLFQHQASMPKSGGGALVNEPKALPRVNVQEATAGLRSLIDANRSNIRSAQWAYNLMGQYQYVQSEVGRAFANIAQAGNQITGYAQKMHEAEQSKLLGQATVEYEEVLAKKRLELSQRTDYNNFLPEWEKTQDEARQALRQNLGPNAQAVFDQKASKAALSGYLRVAERTRSLQVQDHLASLGGGLDRLSQLAMAADPQDLARFITTADQMLGAAVKAGTITPETARQRFNVWQKTVAVGKIEQEADVYAKTGNLNALGQMADRLESDPTFYGPAAGGVAVVEDATRQQLAEKYRSREKSLRNQQFTDEIRAERREKKLQEDFADSLLVRINQGAARIADVDQAFELRKISMSHYNTLRRAANERGLGSLSFSDFILNLTLGKYETKQEAVLALNEVPNVSDEKRVQALGKIESLLKIDNRPDFKQQKRTIASFFGRPEGILIMPSAEAAAKNEIDQNMAVALEELRGIAEERRVTSVDTADILNRHSSAHAKVLLSLLYPAGVNEDDLRQEKSAAMGMLSQGSITIREYNETLRRVAAAQRYLAMARDDTAQTKAGGSKVPVADRNARSGR